MSEAKKATAHYHLPGLFEFHELYRVFLPLFCAHREYFYDWCDIGSTAERAENTINHVHIYISG